MMWAFLCYSYVKYFIVRIATYNLGQGVRGHIFPLPPKVLGCNLTVLSLCAFSLRV